MLIELGLLQHLLIAAGLHIARKMSASEDESERRRE
jgi:hypothetical protein